MSFIPPISEFHIGSTSAIGGAASALVPISSCTPPSIPPFQPLSQPQSTNLFTSAMSWGAPTRDGTPVSRQQTPISQPPPVLFKPQTTFQPIPPHQQYQQPPQQQYQYQEAEERYDDEDEGWVPPAPQQPWNRGRGPPRRAQQHQPLQGQQRYSDHHFCGNPAHPLYFAQPRGQSVASHFQPWEYDESSPIYIPDAIESQVEIRPQLLGILPEFRGRAIQDFQQKPGKAFREAWDRLKELMRSCPHHNIPKWQLVKLSNGSKANFSTRKTVGTAAAVGSDADWKKDVKKEISGLNKKFDRLVSTLQNGPQSQSQGGQGGPKTQEANQVYGQGQGLYNNGRPYRPYNLGQQNFNNQRQNNYQGQSSNQPRQYQPANNSGNANGNSNNRGPNNSIKNAP
ncbi:hypothetical protein L2E82_39430 [Cichorium intybus]|uniref:Uncharacterized protein n=1 Tax=Cichorium intybus TaxID=13427 RepID=A0ACB9AHG9_CICIN|nr:hypothetical protein L2E82_39430 [Cichorium intybus]